MLGIDRQRLYNIARADADELAQHRASALRGWATKAMGLRPDGTKHPFHLIRDIKGVAMADGPRAAFSCVIRDPFEISRRKEYHYEAASNDEAAEIVAKLQHLMRMSHSTDKPPAGDDERAVGEESSTGMGHRRSSTLGAAANRRPSGAATADPRAR